MKKYFIAGVMVLSGLVTGYSNGNADSTATVYIYRPTGGFRTSDFKITVNQTQHLYLRRQQTDTLHLQPGNYTFDLAELPLIKSQSLNLDLAPNEVVYLRVYESHEPSAIRTSTKIVEVTPRMYHWDQVPVIR